jgi:hypothetical protein
LTTMAYSDEDRAGLSATTFLTLCIAWGPNRACFAIMTVAIGALWIALCRRYPAVGTLTGIFIVSFVQGLFGSRRRYRR